jgi:hypothetical protein
VIGLTLTKETPFSARATAAGLEASLVTPRTSNLELVDGSSRIVLITEPPWLPVAPKTTIIFLDDIIIENEILDSPNTGKFKFDGLGSGDDVLKDCRT